MIDNNIIWDDPEGKTLTAEQRQQINLVVAKCLGYPHAYKFNAVVVGGVFGPVIDLFDGIQRQQMCEWLWGNEAPEPTPSAAQMAAFFNDYIQNQIAKHKGDTK